MLKKALQSVLLIVLFFPSVSLYGFGYDQVKLDIFAKLLPRFVLMSSEKESIDGEIVICLLREKSENNSDALFLQEKIESNVIKKIKSSAIEVTYGDKRQCSNANIVFLFNLEEDNLKESIEYFRENKILTVSYDPLYLKYGTNISIFFGAKVVPYLNAKSIYDSNISIDNILFRISKIYHGN